jgi:hypothetical protein
MRTRLGLKIKVKETKDKVKLITLTSRWGTWSSRTKLIGLAVVTSRTLLLVRISQKA